MLRLLSSRLTGAKAVLDQILVIGPLPLRDLEEEEDNPKVPQCRGSSRRLVRTVQVRRPHR
jgi:hypothetical protein